jgi:hypothetical protein
MSGADAFEKVALWDTDTIAVTAAIGPMERSNLKYYNTHLRSTCVTVSGHSRLRQVLPGT